MPFTLSHPAAAIPLARRGLVLSALVVGSMVPDLPYFIPRIHSDHFGHTLAGIIYFCVPAGLALLWIYHCFLKLPLLSLLPRRVQARLMPVALGFTFRPWRRLMFIVYSLALGALTHIVWDLVTHSDGWAVEHYLLLNLPILGRGHSAFRLYVLLQYGSSLIGGFLIIYWFVRWCRHAPAAPVSLPSQLPRAVKAGYLLLIGLGAFAVATVYAFVRTPYLSGFRSYDHFLRHALVAGIFIMAIELLVFSLLWHLLIGRRSLSSPQRVSLARDRRM